MPDSVRELRAPGWLEVEQQVQLATVIRAVTRQAAERHDAQRLAAAAQRPRYEMGWVHPVLGAAHDARASGDGGALSIARSE
jgi:hypothetical protein